MLNSNPTVKAALVVAAIAAFTPGCQYFREPAGRAGLSAATARLKSLN